MFRMSMRKCAIAIAAAFLSAPSFADRDITRSPYAGEEARAIKSLSPEDIAELRRGGGWGFAKTAELNGVPGPTHLLEMKEEIGLDTEQTAAIEEIRNRMQAAAIEKGETYIDLEARLEAMFRDRSVTETALRQTIGAIEEARGALRYAHLKAHLETLPLLTAHQIAAYNRLRGYASDAVHGAGHGG